MSYRWNDYRFDPSGALLTKAGLQIDLSRKVLDCIACLIVQRHRVVPYQELMRKLWGHDKITNHQLTQIVTAARRAVGDSGQTQAVIRNMSGLGYRWVQPVIDHSAVDSAVVNGPSLDGPAVDGPAVHGQAVGDSEPPSATVCVSADAERPASSVASVARSTALPTAGPTTRPTAPEVAPSKWFVFSRRPRRTELALLLALSAVAATRHVAFEDDVLTGLGRIMASASEPQPSVAAVPDTIDGLREAMRMGRHELVRKGLAELPTEMAVTDDARMLLIEMDIEQWRFDEAERKLALELKNADSAADRLWRAKLLTLQSEARAEAALGAASVLPPAKAAVALLESAGEPSASHNMGRALSARGNGFLIENDLGAAIADLVRAREILQKGGDESLAAKAQRYLAHAWLREGRMTDALTQIVEAANSFERLQDPINEMAARNMATRIQVEQLRWDEALVGSERSLRLSEKFSASRRSLGALQLRGFVLTHLGRLREARSFFDEVHTIGNHQPHVFQAWYALTAGRPQEALAHAAQGFETYGPEARLNLSLESRDGALLLWTMGAQAIAARGEPMPVPTAAQMAALERPETDVARIARSRWLSSQGRVDAAENELRRVLANAGATGRLHEMLLATEVRIDMLLARDDTAAAQRALAEMWGRDPDRFRQDYRANLLALRIALASGDGEAIATAHRQTLALAGERALPLKVLKAYAERTSRVTGEVGSQMASSDSAY